MHPAFPTSYDTNYVYEPPVVHRRIRYRDLPSMEPRARQALQANFITRNDHLAKGPHRRLDTEKPTGLELGLGGAAACRKLPDLFADKPIVRSSRPQVFNKETLAQTERMASKLADAGVAWKKDEPSLFSDAMTKRMSVRRRWTSTTREATEEAALPTPRCAVPPTTLEPCADSVRHRVGKYEARPCVWQQYAREWDLMQPRRPMPPVGQQKADDVTL